MRSKKQLMIMKRRVKLGQHFLIDRDVLAEIIRCADIKKGERVVEVGPGRGILTKELLKKGARVTAVEIDSRLADILRKELGGNKNLKIINQDILDFCHSERSEESLRDPSSATQDDKYKIIANLPYQITSPVIRKFLENKESRPKLMVLMVQREVAERIVASPGDSRRGFLSVVVQYYSQPEIVRIVPKESFYPIPKVESAILKIKNKKLKIKNNEKNLFKIVQAGFSQKRKKLRNSLAGGLRIEPKEADQLLQKAGIDSNLRAEDLEVDEWKIICR